MSTEIPPETQLVERKSSYLRKPTRPTEARVAEIIELMISHTWDTMTHTDKEEIRERWGISDSRFRDVCSEASRFINLCVDPDQVKRYAMVKLRGVVESNEHDRVHALRTMLDATASRVAIGGDPRAHQNLSREQRVARATEYFRNPDDELLEALALAGWIRPQVPFTSEG